MTQAPPAIRLEGLGLSYAGSPVFEGLDFTFPAGTFSVLLGPSGVGKTSLLRSIALLDRPTAGRVVADDAMSLAGRVAWMGQQDLLLPWARVIDNVTMGARLRGAPIARDRAEALLRRVGLGDRLEALPSELSGGMRQRVALARTLYEDRPVVLMDEPFSALDSVTRARMQDLAADMLRDRTVVLITHDPLEACRLGQVILLLAGSPARLSPVPTPDGATPRPADDPGVLRGQGHLMRRLLDGIAA
ncbi:ATP-binding cassette domain-containing protein [Gluconacetobacter tumulisoli]|uniref:ABC transporter ATP-binding protein n=1 Tax=Gluconacetobacter tumulisoli TaxID=1286189 RepID=A0A7W4PLQ2_9PROT|nr:ABC transporter ATP-binding protein [Gluconacetobacter tumulisoli]